MYDTVTRTLEVTFWALMRSIVTGVNSIDLFA